MPNATTHTSAGAALRFTREAGRTTRAELAEVTGLSRLTFADLGEATEPIAVADGGVVPSDWPGAREWSGQGSSSVSTSWHRRRSTASLRVRTERRSHPSGGIGLA